MSRQGVLVMINVNQIEGKWTKLTTRFFFEQIDSIFKKLTFQNLKNTISEIKNSLNVHN
jgi:hypothetical protein